MNEFIKQYNDNFSLYETFANRVESLLVEVTKAQNIKLHFTESRAKNPDSVKEKLTRPDKSYKNPAIDIPDLVGVRLVLYYQDDIEKIGEVLNSEFNIIETEKDHQAEKYSPDKFGYLSVHYIVKLNKVRANLTEWRNVSHLHAEIQVRTVLQHSWAAISHALQYKREGDVASPLRRKLYRLAGLFELADEQFIEIRDQRASIETESQKAVKSNKVSAELNSSMIKDLVKKSSRMQEIIDYTIKLGARHSSDDVEKDFFGVVIEELERVKVFTIKDFNNLINQDYTEFFQNLELSRWSFSSSFILYLLVIAQFPNNFSVNYLVNNGGWDESVAEEVLKAIPKSKPNKSLKQDK